MFLKELADTRMSDYNRVGKLSLEGILKLLENEGSHHMMKVHDKLNNHGIAWMLVDWKIQIKKRPVIDEKIYLETWARGKAPTYTTFREFIMTNEKGEEYIIASAKYVLYDINTNKITKITGEQYDIYEPEEKMVFDTEITKMPTPAPETEISSTPVTLRRSDIDINEHVHNTKYINYVTECLDYETYLNEDFKSIRVSYKHSVKPNDTVTVKQYKSEEGYLFAVFANETLSTLVELK